jgi:transcriptional regulator with XRE-family HTH domain
MTDQAGTREILVGLREEANLSQAELAKRLPFTASRISRLESGEIALTEEDVQRIAEAIATPAAKTFAGYLNQDWQALEKPGFNHISREALWTAEGALRRLRDLEDDPELKNAFLQQLKSCRLGLERSAKFLQSTEHPIAFMGSPGVGKTTAICTLSDLKKPEGKDLNRQMVLQTGSGRTTVCEVHVRNGGDYGIVVEPCSAEELRQYVVDYCEHLLRTVGGTANDGTSEGPGVSAEVERALRNMTGLTIKTTKGTDGKTLRDDPALELARRYPSKEDLHVQIISRLDLARRNRTSISRPHDSTISGIDWVGRTFAEINYGRHLEFSLPRRIEVTVPNRILGSQDLDLRLIDTRGIDEPSAPRRDLQTYLDDERTISVLCSAFKSAPDAATQAVIERAIEGGLRESITGKGMLLVLPQSGDETGVRDNGTGEIVASAEEGREIRRDQIVTTLDHVGTRHLEIGFLDVQNDSDGEKVKEALLIAVGSVRARHERQIEALRSTVDQLIANRANEEAKAVFEAAVRPLRVWFANNQSLPKGNIHAEKELLEDMDGLRYASSLRASINRHGHWDNFDYWHGLGFGARRETVERSANQTTVLKGLIATTLSDPESAGAHAFLRHFQSQVETGTAKFYQDVQTLGEAAFLDQLTDDSAYWSTCYNRWGGGPGYKNDIRHWTDEWFSDSNRKDRYDFIESEVQRRWRELVERLQVQLASVRRENEAAAA